MAIIGPMVLKAQVSLSQFEIPASYLSSGKLLINNSALATDFKFYITLLRDALPTGGYVPGNCTVTLLYTENPNNLTEATTSLNYESDPTTIELMTPKNVISSDYNFAIANFDGTKAISAKLPANKTKGRIIFRYKYFSAISNKDVIKYASTRYNIILPAPTYYNVAKSHTFYKNNCNWTTESGNSVTYVVAAGTYSSTVSQAEADNFAENAVFLYGQDYANVNGTCTINPNKLITYAEFPQVSDTFAVLVYWNKNKISSSTVSFEVYQYGVLKGVVASNISNTGMANLNIIQYLQIDGHTFRNVRLKLISDADPNVNEFTPGVDWLID